MIFSQASGDGQHYLVILGQESRMCGLHSLLGRLSECFSFLDLPLAEAEGALGFGPCCQALPLPWPSPSLLQPPHHTCTVHTFLKLGTWPPAPTMPASAPVPGPAVLPRRPLCTRPDAAPVWALSMFHPLVKQKLFKANSENKGSAASSSLE